MKIVLNIEKKHFYIILAVIVAISSIIFVRAYGSGGPPTYFGHSVEEIEGFAELVALAEDSDGDGIIDDCEITPTGNLGDTSISVQQWTDFNSGGYLCTYMKGPGAGGICSFH